MLSFSDVHLDLAGLGQRKQGWRIREFGRSIHACFHGQSMRTTECREKATRIHQQPSEKESCFFAVTLVDGKSRSQIGHHYAGSSVGERRREEVFEQAIDRVCARDFFGSTRQLFAQLCGRGCVLDQRTEAFNNAGCPQPVRKLLCLLQKGGQWMLEALCEIPHLADERANIVSPLLRGNFAWSRLPLLLLRDLPDETHRSYESPGEVVDPPGANGCGHLRHTGSCRLSQKRQLYASGGPDTGTSFIEAKSRERLLILWKEGVIRTTNQLIGMITQQGGQTPAKRKKAAIGIKFIHNVSE